MPARRALTAPTAAVVVTLLAAAFLAAPPARAAEAPVGLGTADSFAVLAGSGITNTGPTTVTGDLGTFPTPSETGFGSITLDGTNHGGDAVTRGAKDDLVLVYVDAAGRTPANAVAVELGGSTLRAGVYRSPTLGLTGVLRLDAEGDPNAQFVFQAASTLIAEANSNVLLLNGANPCRVVWQVGSSATFKTGTRFVGDVLAYTSVTAQRATFRGRLLARNGAVTLDTNTITRSSCASTTGGTPTTTSAPTGAGTSTSAPTSPLPGATGPVSGATAATAGTATGSTATGSTATASTATAAGAASGTTTGDATVVASAASGRAATVRRPVARLVEPRGPPRIDPRPRRDRFERDRACRVALAVLALGAVALVGGRRMGARQVPPVA